MQSQLACMFTNHTTNAVLKLQERGDYHLLCPLLCPLFAILIDVALYNLAGVLIILTLSSRHTFIFNPLFYSHIPSSILSILALQ